MNCANASALSDLPPGGQLPGACGAMFTVTTTITVTTRQVRPVVFV